MSVWPPSTRSTLPRTCAQSASIRPVTTAPAAPPGTGSTPSCNARTTCRAPSARSPRRERGRRRGGIGPGGDARVHLPHRGQRHADHADGLQHPRRREAERQVRGQQRERQLGAPAPQVIGAPVELVVAGHRDVDRQLPQRQERPRTVADRAERAALREVAGVDPPGAAGLGPQVVDGRLQRRGARQLAVARRLREERADEVIGREDAGHRRLRSTRCCVPHTVCVRPPSWRSAANTLWSVSDCNEATMPRRGAPCPSPKILPVSTDPERTAGRRRSRCWRSRC